MMRALILLLSLSVAPAQITFNRSRWAVSPPPSTTPPDQRCVVSGTVVNALSGEPLKKANIRLELQNAPAPDFSSNPKVPGYATSSAADGSFRFESIEPGDYRLLATHSGYLNTAYGAKNSKSSGTMIALRRTQQMTGLKLSMSPQGVVTGRVLDSDGDPLEGIVVSLIHQTWRDGKLHFDPVGMHQTNDLGEYRIAGVPPGQYYVLTEKARMAGMPDEISPIPGKPDIREIRTYYPDSIRMNVATKIQLTAGQELPDINIRLQSSATYHIRGKVTGVAPRGSDFSRISVRASAKGDDMSWIGSAGSNLNKDHSFDLAGLTPGTYDVTIFEMGGAFQPLGNQTVELGTADTNGVVLSVVPPITIEGQLRFEGKPATTAAQPDLSTLHMNLFPADAGVFGRIPEAKFSENGSFTIEDVSPGKYRLQPPHVSGTYLSAVRFGQQDFLDKDLDLTTGASGELEITLRYGTGELTGSIQCPDTSNGHPVGSVVLISIDNRSENPHIESTSTNQDGSFSIKDITPGTYRAYALEEITHSSLQNPDLRAQLTSFGKEVKIQENGTQQTQLTLIPADTLQGIYSRLGIESE